MVVRTPRERSRYTRRLERRRRGRFSGGPEPVGPSRNHVEFQLEYVLKMPRNDNSCVRNTRCLPRRYCGRGEREIPPSFRANEPLRSLCIYFAFVHLQRRQRTRRDRTKVKGFLKHADSYRRPLPPALPPYFSSPLSEKKNTEKRKKKHRRFIRTQRSHIVIGRRGTLRPRALVSGSYPRPVIRVHKAWRSRATFLGDIRTPILRPLRTRSSIVYRRFIIIARWIN